MKINEIQLRKIIKESLKKILYEEDENITPSLKKLVKLLKDEEFLNTEYNISLFKEENFIRVLKMVIEECHENPKLTKNYLNEFNDESLYSDESAYNYAEHILTGARPHGDGGAKYSELLVTNDKINSIHKRVNLRQDKKNNNLTDRQKIAKSNAEDKRKQFLNVVSKFSEGEGEPVLGFNEQGKEFWLSRGFYNLGNKIYLCPMGKTKFVNPTTNGVYSVLFGDTQKNEWLKFINTVRNKYGYTINGSWTGIIKNGVQYAYIPLVKIERR